MTIDEFIFNLGIAIFNPLIMLIFAIALIVFLWGIIEYIKGAGSPDSREQGTRHIIWGLVGLTIMSTVYGIIQLALDTVFGGQ